MLDLATYLALVLGGAGVAFALVTVPGKVSITRSALMSLSLFSMVVGGYGLWGIGVASIGMDRTLGVALVGVLTFSVGVVIARRWIPSVWQEQTEPIRPKSSDAVEQEPLSSDAPRVVVGPGDIAPETLIGYFATHSSLEASKLTEVFKGQRIKRLTGVVADVIGGGDRPAVMIYFDRDFHYLLAYFEKEWEARASAKQPGTPITIGGTIKDVDRRSVILEGCELVEPRPGKRKPAAPRS